MAKAKMSKPSSKAAKAGTVSDRTGLYLVAVVAIVAVFALGVMVAGGRKADLDASATGEAVSFKATSSKMASSKLDAEQLNPKVESNSPVLVRATYDLSQENDVGEAVPYYPSEEETGSSDAPSACANVCSCGGFETRNSDTGATTCVCNDVWFCPNGDLACSMEQCS